MRFVKDRFFSGLFSFTSSRTWVYLSLIFAVVTMNFLGIKGQDSINYGWLFLGLIVLFIGLPLFFSLKYFREIPENMSREQYDDWKKVEPFIVPDKFHIPPYWLGVIGVCAVIVSVAVVSKNFVFLAFVPPILISSLFGWVILHLIRNRQEINMSNALMKNAMAEYESDMEARYGIHYKKWILCFMGFSIGMLPVMFLGGNALLFAPIYFGVLIFFLKKARFKFRGQIKFGGSGGGGVGGFRAPSPLKESEWRDREQERRNDAKREWESKYGYSD